MAAITGGSSMAQPQHWQPEPPPRAAAVEAQLNYLAYDGKRPVTYARSLPSGSRVEGPPADPHTVRIQNARRVANAPALDRNGFQLLSHRSQVSDFSREAVIRDVYYAEAIEAIQHATGASSVVVFDHTLRYAKPNHGEVGIREPGNRVHNDQTFVSGPRRVRDHLPSEEALKRLEKRHAIINFWRPISYSVQNWPLAMCD